MTLCCICAEKIKTGELCATCEKECAEIDAIQAKGHSHHCACRQVWGDGECECDLYKQGYDPYAWIKRGMI